MKNFLDSLLRNADGVGGGAGDGSSTGDAGGTGTGDTGTGTAGDGAASGAAGAQGDQNASSGTGIDIYKPDGLPETMLGKSDKETIDNTTKALKGYRDRDAINKVPEKAEEYATFAADVPDTIKPHLETLKADPLFGRVAEKALELKVSLPAYQGLVQEFLSVSAEMGLMEPIVDVAAEKTALLPENAKHLTAPEQTQAIEQRMNTNFAFLDAMVARGADKGGLAKEDADFAKAMLGDSAKGHRVFEWMARTAGGGFGGNGPAMNSNGASNGSDPKGELQARAALPKNTAGHREFDRASWDQLQADYKKVHGS